MEQLIIQEKNAPNYILLELIGPVNSYTFAEFEKRAYEIIKETHLVLDMSKVNAIDSCGLSVLFGCFNDGKPKNRTVFLRSRSKSVV